MKKWLLSRFFVVLLVLGAAPSVFADDVADEIAQLKMRITALEQKIESQPANSGDRETLDKIRSVLNGISVSGGVTGIVQGVSGVNATVN